MILNEEINRALLQALACRDDRKRAEQALEVLRRKENEAIEHLRELVRSASSSFPPNSSVSIPVTPSFEPRAGTVGAGTKVTPRRSVLD
jgi:hypothetical protein